MVCTKTLYNEVWAGNLDLTVMDLPEALKRKKYHKNTRKNKKCYGTSIDERPEDVDLRTEEGYWEGDTVVGKRNGREAVILTPLEKKTSITLRFEYPARPAEDILAAADSMNALPRKKLGYAAPEELLEAFLDSVYAA